MDGLDLDIGNYSLKEIEQFFKLKGKYTAYDVELRETQIRTQLIHSGMVEAKYIAQLVDFLSKAKQWIIVAKCDIVAPPTTLPKNPQLDLSEYPGVVTYNPSFRQNEIIEKPKTPFINTLNTEYQDGQLNPLMMRTMTKCLTIDTRFRDNYYSTQSSDLLIQLPVKFSKVVSMQLSAIELPITFYGMSSAIGNNFFYLEVTYQSSPSADETTEVKIITLPDGNYNANDLVYTLNTILAPVADDGVTLVYPDSPFSYIQLSLDITSTGSGTGKVYIQANPAGMMTISNIKMDFTRDSNGDVQNVDLSKKMGWNLGFTQPVYDGNIIYMGDTVVEPNTIRYVYLAVDDFNHSVNNHFVAAYNKSTLSSNILARISLKGSYFTLIMENDLNMITEPRKYFGPVDIQKLRVQLLDDHGRVMSMNNSNYSFCLTFKMMYE